MTLRPANSVIGSTRCYPIPVSSPTGAAISTGDGQAYAWVPTLLDGYVLTEPVACVATASSSGAVTVQVRNVTQAHDMLSTAITIDANESTSYTAATPPVVNAANAAVAVGDAIAIDVDGAGTGTKGLFVLLTFAPSL